MNHCVPLNKNAHKHIKVSARNSFADIAEQNSVALTVDEFSAAASSFPIVFIKDGKTGSFYCVALFAFEAGQNLYCSLDKAEWEGVYVPAAIRRTPFTLGPDPEQEKTLMMYIDESSTQVNNSQGNALFDEGGKETGFFKSVASQLSDYYNSEILTQTFISTLLEKGLLKEIELLLKFNSAQSKRIKGFYTIDEEALNKLDNETVANFFKQNYFVPIYSALNSITQFNRMLRLHNNIHTEKIENLSMRAPGDEEI